MLISNSAFSCLLLPTAGRPGMGRHTLWNIGCLKFLVHLKNSCTFREHGTMVSLYHRITVSLAWSYRRAVNKPVVLPSEYNIHNRTTLYHKPPPGSWQLFPASLPSLPLPYCFLPNATTKQLKIKNKNNNNQKTKNKKPGIHDLPLLKTFMPVVTQPGREAILHISNRQFITGFHYKDP